MARLGVAVIGPPAAAALLAAGGAGSVSWHGSRRWRAVGSVAAAFHQAARPSRMATPSTWLGLGLELGLGLGVGLGVGVAADLVAGGDRCCMGCVVYSALYSAV